MKDSDINLDKSSSDSENLVNKIIPEMPKDKRTKAYKEWVKQFGNQLEDNSKKSSSKIPEMPKDKRTKAYKEWLEKYGDLNSKSTDSSKVSKKKKSSSRSKSRSLTSLVNLFVENLELDDWYNKRKDLENLRSEINSLLKEKNDESDEFKISKDLFLKSIKSYSFKKKKYFKELSSNQNENLEKRKELIEKIKGLISVDENPNKLYNKFKVLKEQWHSTGLVPISERNNIWETYRHHVGKFYDFLHLNRDLRELDYKLNYDEKIKIIEKAEGLDKIDDIIKASRDLNDLHRLWKNELGPVSKEHSEELWNRFQSASKKIHQKRQEYQKDFLNIQNDNYLKKEKIINQMKDLIKIESNSHSDWQKKIKSFEDLKIEFQKIKNLQKSKNKKCWNDFRIVTKDFNTSKNSFYKNQKKELKISIDKKKKLIEELKNIIDKNLISENTSRIKSIQEDWKNIGYLPRKISNSLWNEFRPLVNKYYDILKSGSINLSKDEEAVYNSKTKFIDKVKLSKKDKSLSEVKESFNKVISEWNELGGINKNSQNILNNSLSKKLNSLLNSSDLTKIEKDDLAFELEIELQKNNPEEISKKVQFIKRKISDLEDESNQFQNNLEFFSDSSSENPLIKNVTSKIESINERIDFWKRRLNKAQKI